MGIARIHCYFGRHVRSRGRARRVPEGWHSYCRRCGIEMVKRDGGEWTVVAPPQPDPDQGEGGVAAALPLRSRWARLLRRG